MAWPWLAIVARTVPWTELVRRAPQIISASTELLEKRHTGTRPADRTPPDEADEREMERRIASLEERDAEHARVFEQLAEQTRDLSVGLQVVAARLRLLAWIVAAAVLLAVVAVIFLV
ncbi:MAG: hypothetical protein WD795_12745 [Woeseia sp.]